ncbi:hypothetical protein DFP72DRAFT_846882 [Ephemerocybe angulata]|uniref:Uncharacterized protein n=1 Tax=Ephemerocybe angulata TaxID=980116 RepID=A0A8H6HZV2_9AGAR|nr:hypothetical protein DFP72DRAFT_846882 [Tulosesus angulatus]
MQAYRLAKQILSTRYPSRWGQKCAGAHEDMRTSFVWLYLKLKYGEDHGRKRMAGRIFRVSRTPASKLPAALRDAASSSRQVSSQIDHELAEHLGLLDELNKPPQADPVGTTPACFLHYAVGYRPDSSTFELVHYPSPTTSHSEGASEIPQRTKWSFLDLVDISLNGSFLSGGSVDIYVPWTFTGDSVLRLLDRHGQVLTNTKVKFQCHGKRIFVLLAIQSVLPEAKPFSKMVLKYTLSRDSRRVAAGPSLASSSPLIQGSAGGSRVGTASVEATEPACSVQPGPGVGVDREQRRSCTCGA